MQTARLLIVDSLTAGTVRRLVTLTFELLTFKLVYELHQRWGTFQIWARVTLDLCTRETDRQKQHLLPPFLRTGHNN